MDTQGHFSAWVTCLVRCIVKYFLQCVKLGPVVGSLLYSAGGFGMPFWIVGSVAAINAIYLIAALPKFIYNDTSKEDSEDSESEMSNIGKTLTFTHIIKVLYRNIS